jgi:hypothetical protein
MFLLCMAFFGVLLSMLLAFFPLVPHEDFVWRKPVVGFVFGLICVLGVLAAFFPKQCTNVLNFGKGQRQGLHGYFSRVGGHHPRCENFSPHVFRIDDRRFCVACTGLTVGGLLALVGTFLYFFADWRVEQNCVLVVLAGLLGVSLGLFQFRAKQHLLRFSLNVFFVLGSFLVLVGIDGLTQSVFTDLFLVALIVFWLFTRISISQWDHERICYACGVAVCEFRKFEEGVELVSAAESEVGADDD